MQRLLASSTKATAYKICEPKMCPNPCDVFINHRGIDTKRTISGLLYNHFTRLKLNAFLDNKSMKPGDRLFGEIDAAIRGCGVGIAVFSPRYCDSYFCLHELALLMESKKRVIPIFYDVKPSQLSVQDDGKRPASEIERFRWALEEAKYTVGLTFDSSNGNWSELLEMASEAVTKNLVEVEEEKQRGMNPTYTHMARYVNPNTLLKVRRIFSLL
ncbi:PREDICTED: TMV resistance protein N [Tarenaya hassleriana]|uniref:TMV resistance protein N n=1 Tax=Tarenaya hassleriana TaxID=28532 RepID=UPI00053C571B|nr:PREDICTED: TMV resistance protein N [Tarenaya hassleriana]